MKRTVLIVCLLAGFAAEAAAETRTLNFTNFDRVRVGYGMHIQITQGENYRVEATGSAEDLDRLEVDQRGSRLEFSVDWTWKWWSWRKTRISLDITLPALRGVDLSGGSEGRLAIETGTERFSADLSGGSTLNGRLTCGDADLNLSGGSKLELSGSGNDLRFDGSGGSEFSLRNFTARSLKANLSGGSESTVSLQGELNADLSGGSELVYYGTATLGSIQSSGGSRIRRGN